MRKPKYNATPREVDGHKFPSGAEAARYEYWKLRLRAGEIAHIDIHPTVTVAGIRWRPDFCIWQEYGVPATAHGRAGVVFFEEVKGVATEPFKIKRKLFDAHHPCKPLRVVTGRQTKKDSGVWIWEDFDAVQARGRRLKKAKREMKERAI